MNVLVLSCYMRFRFRTKQGMYWFLSRWVFFFFHVCDLCTRFWPEGSLLSTQTWYFFSKGDFAELVLWDGLLSNFLTVLIEKNGEKISNRDWESNPEPSSVFVTHHLFIVFIIFTLFGCYSKNIYLIIVAPWIIHVLSILNKNLIILQTFFLQHLEH